MSNEVLIAGCGDLGTALAHQLQDAGISPIGMRRSLILNPTFPYVQADVTSPSSLSVLANLNPDILVYCVAAKAQTDEDYRQHYVEGLRHVLNALNGATHLKHVFFVSSTRMYGESGDALLDENTPPQPLDFGGKRLLEAESLLSKAGRSWTYTALRLTGIYGPGRAHMLSLARSISDWPSQNTWTNRIHRDDAAAFMVHLIQMIKRGESVQDCYVVTDSLPVSQHEVLRWIAGQMGVLAEGPLPLVSGGKRMSNQRMLSTEFRLQYPDYQAGYLAMLAKS